MSDKKNYGRETILSSTPIENTDLELNTAEFHCPCCSARLRFGARIKIARVENVEHESAYAVADQRSIPVKERPETPPIKPRLSDDEKALVEIYKNSGLFDALIDCCSRMPGGTAPKDKEKYLITFFRNARPQKRMIPNVVKMLINQFGPDFQAYGVSNIFGIISYGKLMTFIPAPLFKGNDEPYLTTNGSEIVHTKDRMTAEIWIRSKFGYVKGNGPMFDELRKQSYGSFDTSGL